MSNLHSEKLKLIRDSERLKSKEVADLTGINYSTYNGYELGKAKISLESAIKLFSHPRFHKYQDWFLYDRVDPAKGQIAPALARNMPDEITSGR
ncbi:MULTISPECIES: helix-turn-helix transcriptional regulator [unclassified Pantoea]|uniref:helix-turn-helix domain-containing protein n=1 Tax=unclassified Pantoea TaxID=2630326 RepID=UPI00123293A3|nr:MULTISPECIES: helix-turn-helix transcriptional regulator [unclassified Pantoea]KAA5952028.1 helix-turn-helix transcriptional regulator [Pantoea sp. VH_24]KAA5953462.1 helix-turn-helix transcriptional regulator [Pantoea sp. VH_16]KAA5961692.1 helix-turn-helix transcriptional regulator [Pantoea sp. VH_18]KAA5993324.1 helix-turn-helix transcriptional regulator [Pantoea sp. M_1]KAA5998089.1 helix-turn-helix transcriptional regulator [Pantoea sp. F_7]